MGRSEPPPPEAYGRVTHAERYRVLHAVARAVLDDLTKTFAVERRDHPTADPSGRDTSCPATRLTPVPPDAGPLTVTFTAFPGLRIGLGQWHAIILPTCGCDACDEDPAELVRVLHDAVDALVHGNFEERLTRGRKPTLSFAWTAPETGRAHSATMHLNRREARRLGPPRHTRWAPWPRRAEAQPGEHH